jgi:FkbM family methyltransferase
MIREVRRFVMKYLPIMRIFNKLGGIDYAIYDRSTIIEGAKNIDYFVMDGIKYKVDGYSNYMVTADRFEYDLSDIKPDDIVLDIGTTIGDFTIAAAMKAKRVYAVEPLFCKELEENLKLNNCSNVTVLCYAIGNGENVDLSFNKVERKNVPTCSLLKILNMIQSLYGDKVTFLKCDIEGAEWFIKPTDFDGIRRIEMEIHPNMFPRESFNPELVPYLKKNWNTIITYEDRAAYVLHARQKKVVK